MENYERLLNSISKSSGLDRDEIEKRVIAKQDKISGLISKDGAAQIVAAELGINFDNEIFKIEDISPGARRVNTFGKIINLYPVRTFVRNGRESKVANLIIADETSNIKVVLWDTNHIDLIETNKELNLMFGLYSFFFPFIMDYILGIQSGQLKNQQKILGKLLIIL